MSMLEDSQSADDLAEVLVGLSRVGVNLAPDLHQDSSVFPRRCSSPKVPTVVPKISERCRYWCPQIRRVYVRSAAICHENGLKPTKRAVRYGSP